MTGSNLPLPYALEVFPSVNQCGWISVRDKRGGPCLFGRHVSLVYRENEVGGDNKGEEEYEGPSSSSELGDADLV